MGNLLKSPHIKPEWKCGDNTDRQDHSQSLSANVCVGIEVYNNGVPIKIKCTYGE